eukprot:1158919-Pelagomonas_calceolata.AAC.11
MPSHPCARVVPNVCTCLPARCAVKMSPPWHALNRPVHASPHHTQANSLRIGYEQTLLPQKWAPHRI